MLMSRQQSSDKPSDGSHVAARPTEESEDNLGKRPEQIGYEHITSLHDSALEIHNTRQDITGSLTAQLETDLFDSFKAFTAAEEMRVKDYKNQKPDLDKASGIRDLKGFSNNFEFRTPIPGGILPILSDDPEEQEHLDTKAKFYSHLASRGRSSTKVGNILMDIRPRTPTLRQRGDIKIAIICTARSVADAVKTLLAPDTSVTNFDNLDEAERSRRRHFTGVLASHKVVVFCNDHNDHKSSMRAAIIAADLAFIFTNIKLTFVVGCCEAVPFHPETKENIFLGDCIIGETISKVSLADNPVPALSNVEDTKPASVSKRLYAAALHERKLRNPISNEYLQYGSGPGVFGPLTDYLFPPEFAHSHQREGKKSLCKHCDSTLEVDCCHADCELIGCKNLSPRLIRIRSSADREWPIIHHGHFSLNNRAIGSTLLRDQISNEMNVVAFDKQDHGLSGILPPTIRIQSVSGYADGHIGRGWADYASSCAVSGLMTVLQNMVPGWESLHQYDMECIPVNSYPRQLSQADLLPDNVTNSTEGPHKAQSAHDGGQWRSSASTVTHSIPSLDGLYTHTSSTIPSKSSYTASTWSNLAVIEKIKRGNHEGPLVELNPSLSVSTSSPGTVISDDSNSLGMQDTHASALVDDLAARILECESSTPASQNDLVPRLVALLKAFSLRLGYDGNTGQHRHAMKFVYRYSKQIAERLDHMILPKATSADLRDPQPNMSADEKIEVLWHDTSFKAGLSNNISFRSRSVKTKGTDADVRPNSEAAASIDPASEIEEPSEIELEKGEELNPPAFESIFTRLVKNSTAYSWLVESILNEFRLDQGPSVGSRLNIRHQILRLRPAVRVLHKNQPPPSLNVALALDWDLQSFVRQQSEGLQQRILGMEATTCKDWLVEKARIINVNAIEYAITLTGYANNNFQAMTCKEYLHMVWPETGLSVLRILKAASKNKNTLQNETLPNNTVMDITAANGALSARVSGEANATAETVEILAWITSALQASPFGSGICSVGPRLLLQGSKSRAATGSDPTTPVWHNIQLNFERSILPRQIEGSCWHDMFNNPAVVLGYPTRRRDNSEIGLEITTDVIAMVMQTQRWNVYNSRLYIKAFSAMLVPTKCFDQSVMWHYIYEPEGKFLWFEQEDITHDESVTPHHIAARRHFVGWCSKAISHVGSDSARYADIQEAELDPPKSSFALKGFSLSAGHFGSAVGLSATIGHKDPALRVPLAGFGFLEKLGWVSEQFVVFWDTEFHRGWLVDGASALLHLVRTKLETIWKGKLKDLVLIRRSEPNNTGRTRHDFTERNQIIEPNTTDDTRDDFISYPEAALRFFTLGNLRNMKLQVQEHSTEMFKESTGGNAVEPTLRTNYVLLQHIVENLLDALAGAIYAPSYLKERDGQHFKAYHNEHLDGWNFKALATQLLEFEPVTQTFDCWALPWVEMMRSIKAVTLFGTGFGELIQPSSTDLNCTHWQTLPKGNNYIASCRTTLSEMMTQHKGRPRANPIQLTPDFIWYNQMSSCPTQITCRRKKCIPETAEEVIQIIWNKKSAWPWHRPISTTCSRLQEDGAVIFGYPDDCFKRHLQLHWTNLLKGIQTGSHRPPSTQEAVELDNSSQPSSSGSRSLQTSGMETSRTTTTITTPDMPTDGARPMPDTDGWQVVQNKGKKKRISRLWNK